MTRTRWFFVILLVLLALLPTKVDPPAPDPHPLPSMISVEEERTVAFARLRSTVVFRSPTLPKEPARDVWWDLAQCENDKSDDSRPFNARGDRHHGWFQFLLSTWRSVGGTGDPHTHSYEAQRSMAIKLWRKVGRTWRTQWPGCAQRLKLS